MAGSCWRYLGDNVMMYSARSARAGLLLVCCCDAIISKMLVDNAGLEVVPLGINE